MKKVIIPTFVLFFILTFSSCKKSPAVEPIVPTLLDLNFMDGKWIDYDWKHSDDPSETSSLKWWFSAPNLMAIIIDVPENSHGYRQNEIVIKELTSIDLFSFTGKRKINHSDGTTEWMDLTITKIDENQVQYELDCKECPEKSATLYRL